MDTTVAIDAFEALSNDTRLAVFRLLVKAGPKGMSAGEIAERLGVVQNTMSSHLQKLARAGIVASQRQSRHIIYRVDFETVRALILYLLEDCCGGDAELREPLAASLAC